MEEAWGTSLKKYEYYVYADLLANEERLSLHRDLIATIINFGGMGVEKAVSGKELIPLPFTDRTSETRITSRKQAFKLLNNIAYN